MSNLYGSTSGTIIQVLALFGGVALLLVLFGFELVSRTAALPEGANGKAHVRQVLNKQLLFFIVLVVVVVGLVGVGVPALVALGAAFILMVLVYRWLQNLVIVGAVATVLILAIQQIIH